MMTERLSNRGKSLLTSVVTLTIALILMVGRQVIAECVGGVWAIKAPMPTPRQNLGAAVVNGVMYCMGGFAPSVGLTDIVEAYDPATNSWTTKASMPVPKGQFGVGVVNGKIYVLGGRTPSGSTSTVEEFDPATDTWTSKTPMPTARHALAAGVVNGIIYAVGGGQPVSGAEITTVEAYNPGTDSWSVKAPLPAAQSQHGVGVIGGTLYAVGGTGSVGSGNVLRAYDPVSNMWATKAPMSAVRLSPAVSVLNGMLYAAGGTSGPPYQEVDTVEVYDPIGDSWSTEASMPTARSTAAAAILNGALYVAGGQNANNAGGAGHLSALEVFTPNMAPIAIAGPDQSVPCTSSSGASVTLNGTGSFDPDGDPISLHWDVPGVAFSDPSSATPTGTFPIGVTMATLTVCDGRGGVDVDVVIISVVDAAPPEVFCTTNLAALWPPNHGMTPVALYVKATDNCTAPQDLILLSVTIGSNEPDDANGVGDGETSGDVHGADGHTSPVEVSGRLVYNPDQARFEGVALLRAERDGNGVGRAYTIKAWVVDTQYNCGYASCVVVVPRNQRKM